MGHCVCKTYPNVIKVEEIYVPTLNDSPMRIGTNVVECVSKRKAFIKVTSSKNIPVVQLKPVLSSASTEAHLHLYPQYNNNTNANANMKSNTNSKCDYSTSNSTKVFNTIQESLSPKKQIGNELDQNAKNIEIPCSSKEFSEEEERILTKVLQAHFLFKNFDKEDIMKVIEEITVYQYDSNLMLFSQGDIADKFYILKRGCIELSMTDYIDQVRNNNKVIQEKDSFGELALVLSDGGSNCNCIRTYNAKAIDECELYGLECNVYYSLMSKPKLKRNNKDKDRDLIDNILKESYWLMVLKQHQREAIGKMAYIKTYNKNDYVLKDSKLKDLMYIIEGSLVTNVSRKITSNDQKGSCIRLINILSSTISEKCTIHSTTDSSMLLVIQEKVFIEVLGLDYSNEILQAIISNILLRDLFLSKLIQGSLLDSKQLIGAFTLKEYKANQIVYSKGLDSSSKTLILINGDIVNGSRIDKDSKLIIAKEGDLYQSSFLYQSPEFESDYTAKSNLLTLKTSYHELKSLIVSKAMNTEYIHIIFDMLKKFEIFQDIPIETLFNLSKHIKASYYSPNDLILDRKTKIEHLYLLAKGTIKVMALIENNKKPSKIKIIEEGNSFCEFFLLNELNCNYQFKAKNQVTIYTLPLSHFMEILSEPTVNNYIRRKMCFEESNILLTDLFYLSYLGRGRFGNVCLVHNEVSFYALKAISKSFSEKQKFGIKYLFSEKKTMNSLEHPFIIKLVKTFKNDNWCFFLQEFISGKNFSEYLELRRSKRNINETRFYAASLFEVISYIHSRKIIHRDIKPANIMINKNGYIKMIDFGTAIKIRDDMTKTVIGTPNFIAPEVLLGKGYSFPCDYWSVGICLYYIYYGILPFGHNSLELTDTYKEILEKDIKFPDNSNIELNSLLSSLLTKSPLTRYCSLQSIKNHIVFKDFNWDELMRCKLRPPYIPGKDPREDEQSLRNLNSLFISFIENEKYDTKQPVTLKAGNVKPLGSLNNSNNNIISSIQGTGNNKTEVPVDWSEGF